MSTPILISSYHKTASRRSATHDAGRLSVVRGYLYMWLYAHRGDQTVSIKIDIENAKLLLADLTAAIAKEGAWRATQARVVAEDKLLDEV